MGNTNEIALIKGAHKGITSLDALQIQLYCDPTSYLLVHTFLPHSGVQALLESAILAAVPCVFLYGTGSAPAAGIAGVGTDAATEETLARLAAQDAKVVSGGRVSTHAAEGLAASCLRRQSQRAGRRLCGLGVVTVTKVRAGYAVRVRSGRSATEKFRVGNIAAVGSSAAHGIDHFFRERVSRIAVVGGRRGLVAVWRPGVLSRRLAHLGQQLQLRLLELDAVELLVQHGLKRSKLA